MRGDNMSREAMKQALEALEEINKLSIGENAVCLPAEIDTAMDSLRQAIATEESSATQELKREWVGLTDEETQTCWDKAVNTIAPQYSIVRAIEAKLKKKNSP